LVGGLGIGGAVGAQLGLFVHQPIQRNAVTHGDFIVIEVVGAGDLDRAGTEIRIRVVVGDDGNQTPVLFRPDRDFAALADDRRIAAVVGVHGNGAVAEHGLRACGGDGDVVAG